MENGTRTKHPARIYQFVKEPAAAPKGAQRIIVLDLIRSAGRPMSVEELSPLAAAKGLTANAGVTASVAWHLHQLANDGVVKLLNLFVQPAQPAAVPVINFEL
jgi:hypothetical protein